MGLSSGHPLQPYQLLVDVAAGRGVPDLDAQLLVAPEGQHVRVARDQPGAVPRLEVHGLVLAQGRVLRVGVVVESGSVRVEAGGRGGRRGRAARRRGTRLHGDLVGQIGEPRDGLAAGAQPAAHLAQQTPGDRRCFVQQLVEARRVDDLHVHGRAGHDGRRARGLVEEAHLADALALADRSDEAVGDRDVRLALDDHVAVAGGLALAVDHVSGFEVGFAERQRGDAVEVLVAAGSEEVQLPQAGAGVGSAEGHAASHWDVVQRR